VVLVLLDKLGGGGVSRSISIAYGTILRLIS
jgi:hypothetical protein